MYRDLCYWFSACTVTHLILSARLLLLIFFSFYKYGKNTSKSRIMRRIMLTNLQTSANTWSVYYWQFLITYIFSVSVKSRACYITGQWGEFTVKNATLYLHLLSWHFFVVSFFFWWSIEFTQQNINQWETEIGDKKLSVELYVDSKNCYQFWPIQIIIKILKNNNKHVQLIFSI